MTSPTQYAVQTAKTDDDIADCFDCMHELRPNTSKETFVSEVRAMEKEGYRLASIADDGQVVAVAGYRFMHTLFAGDTLYVDDLITQPDKRSHGYGAALIGWLRQQAKDRGCKMLHLDSGVQRARAHGFYFANDMHVNCFHFAELL